MVQDYKRESRFSHATDEKLKVFGNAAQDVQQSMADDFIKMGVHTDRAEALQDANQLITSMLHTQLAQGKQR